MEYASIPTVQNVAPSFYVLRNHWDIHKANDSPEIRKMKREFVKSLDAKMWPFVSTLHLMATILDPTLKAFTFVEKVPDREGFLTQARVGVTEYANSINNEIRTEATDPHPNVQHRPITVNEGGQGSLTQPCKRRKSDPFATFRSSNTPIRTHLGEIDNESINVEIRRYENIEVPRENFDASDTLFNPLQWWAENRFKFPILSIVAKRILVIPGSSSESERHFSTAGKVTRKDRGRLKSDIVEAQVLVNEGLKKKILKSV